MNKKKETFDLSDALIICGFAVLAWGIYEQYGRAQALMVSGGIMLAFGLLIARAIARNKDD